MKKIVMSIFICLLLTGITGCGKTIPKLQNGTEAVVSFENLEGISVDDLYNELKKNYTLSTLLQMIDRQIYEDKFKDSLNEARENAQSTIESIKAQYGDEALSTLTSYTGYTNFEDYEEVLYISNLQTMAYEEYAKTLISDKDIENYYNTDIVGDIKVSHILVTPEVTDDMDATAKTNAEDAAKKEAEDIIKTLKATKAADILTTFESLAKEKSDDQATASNGGSMGFVNKATLGSQYKDFGTAAYNLKDGGYTATAIKSELGYHIILRVESKEKAGLDAVKDSILDTLSNNLITNDATVNINAMVELRKQYGFAINDSELATQYDNYINNQLTQAKKTNEEKTAS